MAKSIVDMLEAIQIQQEDRERIAAPAMPRDRVLDFFHNRQAVGQPGQHVVMRHEGDALLGPLPLGDIVDNNNQMFRGAHRIASHDAARCKDTRLASRHFDFIIVRAPADRPGESLGIGCVHPLGVLPLIDLKYGFPQNFVAAHLEHRFKCPVHKHKLARDGILHDDGDRNVFND